MHWIWQQNVQRTSRLFWIMAPWICNCLALVIMDISALTNLVTAWLELHML
ncbi:hypothetical protein D3C80_2236490 [compost metagenome]